MEGLGVMDNAMCALCGKELEGKAIGIAVYCPSCFVGAVTSRTIEQSAEFEKEFNEASRRIEEGRRRMEEWEPRLIPKR